MNSPALRFLTANAWTMAPEVFGDLVAILERHADGQRLDAGELRAAIGEKPVARETAMYRVGDTAVIPIRGVIARYADQVNGVCQDSGRSAESIQADLRAAQADMSVRRIALRIDSPGGMVAGTAETGQLIRSVSAAGKPVHAFVDGLAASGAYWLASAADSITVSAPTAQVGSIGVITAHYDETAAKERRGVRVHVIRSVALKAPGTEGEALSAEQLDSIQRRIGQLHAVFADHVGQARNLDPQRLAQVTTGEVWAAAQAKDLGLIDGVQDFAAWIAELPTRGSPRRTSPKATAMHLDDLDALITAHPAKAKDIMRLAKEGKDAAAISAHLAEAERAEEAEATRQALTAAQSDLAAERAAHAETQTALEAVRAELAALKGNQATHQDPGAGSTQIKRRSEMNLAEKAAFLKNHGQAAYRALPA